MNPVATLSEIAAQAGVSEATVSRVLNEKAGVSDAARQAVITALDVLGYERPTRLKRRSAGLVGLVVPELENPIFPAFAQVIEDVLAARRYTPVLCTQSPGGISEDEYVESLLDHGVAGIIFVSGRHADSSADHERYRSLVERRMPVVFINGYLDDIEAPYVSADDRQAVDLAVHHLVSLGHRRIGLAVGQARYLPAARKRVAFLAALERSLGLSTTVAESWIEETLFTIEGGAAATTRLIERGATAIICASDPMALGAIRAARDVGLSVPDDVSVVGYDDSTLLQFVDPPLTTVRQPVQAMGAAAVSFLIDAIEGRPVPRNEYIFKPELVLRSSTGPVPARARRRR
jgi:LacI family repressor for deo operon, udp, cdd, tsx, nupC, and nupG